MSDTPEIDAQLTTFTSISKLKKHFVNRTGAVSAEFARKLERERDNLQDQRDFAMSEIERLKCERDNARECYKVAMDLVARYKRERDKVSVLVRRLFEMLDTVEVSDSETDLKKIELKLKSIGLLLSILLIK